MKQPLQVTSPVLIIALSLSLRTAALTPRSLSTWNGRATTPCCGCSSNYDFHHRRRPHEGPSLLVRRAHLASSSSSSSSSRKAPPRRAWPKRIWSRLVTPRKEQQRHSLQASSSSSAEQVLLDPPVPQEMEELLLLEEEYTLDNNDNTDLNYPKYSFHQDQEEEAVASAPQIDVDFYNVSTTTNTHHVALDNDVSPTTTTTATNKAVFVSRWLGNLFESIVVGILEKHAQEPPQGLSIQAYPKANAMGALVTKGQFRTSAQLQVDRLVFPALRMSGGRLQVDRLTLQLVGFLMGQQTTTTRYPQQFDLHAEDWIFSKEDLMESPCITNGLRQLLIRILQGRGVESSTIQVTSLDILPSGKISVKGEAKTLFADSSLAFEVRTGIDFVTRGHVLTFPGLQVSINHSPFFVPVVPTIDIDVGHNARFTDIQIDGRTQRVRFSASVTITPQRTIQLLDKYPQSSQAFSARFSVDVGQWLTNIGNFRQ